MAKSPEERWREIQEALAAPMEFKVKPGTKPKLGRDGKTFYALALGYISREQVQDRFDQVLGIENWQNSWQTANELGKTVRAKIGCRLPGTEDWIFKADIGGPDVAGPGSTDTNLWKTGVSDAFKRAATHWGVGRFLYSLPLKYLPCEVYGQENKFARWVGDPAKVLAGKPGPKPAPPQRATQKPPDEPKDPTEPEGTSEPENPPTEPENASDVIGAYHMAIRGRFEQMTKDYPDLTQEIQQWLVSKAVDAGASKIPEIQDEEVLKGIMEEMDLYEKQIKAKKGGR